MTNEEALARLKADYKTKDLLVERNLAIQAVKDKSTADQTALVTSYAVQINTVQTDMAAEVAVIKVQPAPVEVVTP